MRSHIPIAWVVTMFTLILVGFVVAVFIPSCAGPQDEESDRVAVPDGGVTDIRAVSSYEDWDMEARVEQARLAEAELTKRSVAEPRSDTEEEDSLVEAIIKLQPSYADRRHRARRLAEIIREPAAEYGINPFIALAIAMKESSLLPNRMGALGEEGYWQVMPRGYARRVCSGGCEPSSPRCNARTAICYMDHVRSLCGDSPWVWVNAYGMRRCPREAETRAMRPSRRARGFLVATVGEEEADQIWPM